MSENYWPIKLYGVCCNDLRLKKEVCEGENFGQDDIWDFLCSFNDLFNDFGLAFSSNGDMGDMYIGVPTKYAWENSNPKDFKTELDATNCIIDFIFKYFDVEMSRSEFTKEIDYIEDCGYSY